MSRKLYDSYESLSFLEIYIVPIEYTYGIVFIYSYFCVYKKHEHSKECDSKTWEGSC